jgi:hypothetical protein
MPRKNGQRKHGTSRGSPRPAGTAKASPISRGAVKWRRACEWGRWGRLSEDGPGQNNPDRSEGPWGRGRMIPRMAVRKRAASSTLSEGNAFCSAAHEGQMQTRRRDTWTPTGKALSDRPALKPYWGKPAVRNFRGGRWRRRHHSEARSAPVFHPMGDGRTRRPLLMRARPSTRPLAACQRSCRRGGERLPAECRRGYRRGGERLPAACLGSWCFLLRRRSAS